MNDLDLIITHQAAARAQEADGGITINPFTGQEPKGGFAVAIAPERERKIAADILEPEDIGHFIEKNLDIFEAEPRANLGVWHDPETGIVHLNVSAIESDQEVAE